MNKLLFIASLLLPLVGFAQQKGKVYDLLVGSYTRTNENKGIQVYRFDTQTGKATFLNQAEIENPDYLTISPDGKFVYACNVDTKGGEGHISAFKFDYKTGKLDLINQQPSQGVNPVHIVIDKDSKNVIISHYTSGSVVVLPIKKDGSLGPVSQKIQYTGTGVNPKRQDGPHTHSSMLSPDGKFLFVADLGTDKVSVYHYDNSKAEPLTPAETPFEMVKPGNGPRHITFSPDHKYLYLVQEMGGIVNAYRYDKGKITLVQSINMMPDTFTDNQAADIHLTPDGNFLYASNRASANNITLYTVDKQTGKLTFMERYNVPKAPRGFAIDPTGSFLICGGQDAHMATIYKIDKTTGKLTPGDNMDIGQSVCFKFVSID